LKIRNIEQEYISEDLIKLIEIVSRENNLEDWELELWEIKGENECINDLKLIYLDKTSNDIKKWFIHEITHALLPNNEDNRLHREEWQNLYRTLLKKYNIKYKRDKYA